MIEADKSKVTKAGAVELEEAKLDNVHGAKPITKDRSISANKATEAVRNLL